MKFFLLIFFVLSKIFMTSGQDSILSQSTTKFRGIHLLLTVSITLTTNKFAGCIGDECGDLCSIYKIKLFPGDSSRIGPGCTKITCNSDFTISKKFCPIKPKPNCKNTAGNYQKQFPLCCNSCSSNNIKNSDNFYFSR